VISTSKRPLPYTTHTRKRRTFTPSVAFKPVILAVKRADLDWFSSYAQLMQAMCIHTTRNTSEREANGHSHTAKNAYGTYMCSSLHHTFPILFMKTCCLWLPTVSGSEPTNTEWQDGQRVINGKTGGYGPGPIESYLQYRNLQGRTEQNHKTTQGN
jgi:hypothetical protein